MLPPERPNIVNAVEVTEVLKLLFTELFQDDVFDSKRRLNSMQWRRLTPLLLNEYNSYAQGDHDAQKIRVHMILALSLKHLNLYILPTLYRRPATMKVFLVFVFTLKRSAPEVYVVDLEMILRES